jgi:ketosteroid isomerase-like protein
MAMPEQPFDVDRFRAAYRARDLAAWLEFYAEDAAWISCGPNGSDDLRCALGHAAIAQLLRDTARWPEVLAVGEPEVEADRVRFRAWCRKDNGERSVTHVMLLTERGRIRRQVDVDVTNEP